jgi:hypothetical protein
MKRKLSTAHIPNKQAAFEIPSRLVHLSPGSKYTDFTFRFAESGATLKCHRCVLIQLEYFERMFDSPMQEAQEGVCVLHDDDEMLFRCFIQFLYDFKRGTEIINTPMFLPLAYLACRYGYTILQDYLLNDLRYTIDVSNCITLWRALDDIDKDSVLADTIVNFMNSPDRFLLFCRDKAYKNLSQEEVTAFITDFVSLKDVHFAITEWINHDEENRKAAAYALLSLTKEVLQHEVCFCMDIQPKARDDQLSRKDKRVVVTESGVWKFEFFYVLPTPSEQGGYCLRCDPDEERRFDTNNAHRGIVLTLLSENRAPLVMYVARGNSTTIDLQESGDLSYIKTRGTSKRIHVQIRFLSWEENRKCLEHAVKNPLSGMITQE